MSATYNLLRSSPTDSADVKITIPNLSGLAISEGIADGDSEVEVIGDLVESSILNKATWTSCYFNLTSTIIGAGILGLPHAFASTGWINGTILLIVCACSSAFALHFLAKCAKKLKLPATFYSVAEVALPGYSYWIDLAVAIKCYGVATSYLVVIGDLMPSAMEQLHFSSRLSQRSLWVSVGFLVVAPLSCFQSLDALKYTSFLSTIFIYFLVIIIVLFTFPSLSGLDACSDYAIDEVCKGGTDIEKFDTSSLRALSVFVFGYTCQQNLFSVINELRSPTQERVDGIILVSIGTALTLFLIVGYCGYSTYGNNVASDLLKSYPEVPVTTAARICVSFIVSFCYPLQCNPARRSVLTLLRNMSGGAEPSISVYRVRYTIITGVFLITSLLIALTVTDLGIVLAFVGATGSTIVSYILPGIFYYKMFKDDREEPSWKKVLSFAQFVAGLIIIPVCLSVLILK